MLSINNWRFNANLKNKFGETPSCRPENWTVEIKLSSTAFSGGNSVKPVISSEGHELFFDQNGLHMAYESFIGLLKKTEFANFLRKLKKTYEEQKHLESLASSSFARYSNQEVGETEEDVEENDEEEEEEITFRKKRRVLDDEEEDNNEQTQEILLDENLKKSKRVTNSKKK